jgi:hypothetical protein
MTTAKKSTPRDQKVQRAAPNPRPSAASRKKVWGNTFTGEAWITTDSSPPCKLRNGNVAVTEG